MNQNDKIINSVKSTEYGEYAYILEKINTAEFIEEPYLHIEIENIFNEKHKKELIKDKQIFFDSHSNLDDLFDTLKSNNYVPVPFPGATTKKEFYVKHLTEKYNNKGITDSIGMVFRLKKELNSRTKKLITFLNSEAFKHVLLNKFNIDKSNKTFRFFTGIQKYLTNYQIPPHPDIKNKCIAYLININDPRAEKIDTHTHIMKLKDDYKSVTEYWNKNPNIERTWLPWEWCETVKKTNKNFSMLIFPPSSSSFHAVKFNYNHLPFQRTQLYGNIFYDDKITYEPMDWLKLKNVLNLP